MVRINQMRYDYNEWIINENGKVYFWEKVKPRGSAKAMPDYIPQAIRNDYEEACLIRDLSPKASATLSRRCLQGMIRNFAKPEAKSDKLFDEIKALEAAIEDGTAPREVSADSVAALTAVRKVGNIGAHMEANVDVIVDVDAGEAQVLIELIESLLQDWYVERHKRQQRFAATTQLAVEKDKQIKDARAGQKALAAPALSGQGAAEEPAA
jgi:dGTP triphosphohydrolase